MEKIISMTTAIESHEVRPDFLEVSDLIEELHSSLTGGVATRTPTEAMARLTSIYRGAPEEVRYEVLTELVGLEYIGARELLVEALQHDKSALVRHEAAFGLGIVGTSRHITVLKNAMLEDPNPMVRHEAAIALAMIGGEGALGALSKAERDSDPEVAASARYGVQIVYLRAHRELE